MRMLHKISVVVRCPHCRRAARWSGRFSRRELCPNCGRPFIALHDEGQTCEVRAESEDAVSEMVCDWLGPEDPDDDDEESEPRPEAQRKTGRQ